MVSLAEKLADGAEAAVDATRVRLFYRKRVGYLSMSLAVGRHIGGERDAVTTLLGNHGAAVNQFPFTNYGYEAVIAKTYKRAQETKKEEVYDAINATYPKKLTLGAPTF